ncbi:hypothetical protein OIO90_005950 [Microbotryomycetes sp. JL221]|nr:hypothetical protein OIO90_005950 [Microbotryomycetes sp. JL221]
MAHSAVPNPPLDSKPVHDERLDDVDSEKLHTDQGQLTTVEERRVVKKLDAGVMTLVCILFLCSFLDRSNIGNANAAGMSEHLGLSPDQYDNLLTLFYVGYVVGQPMTLLWKAVPPHILVAFLTLMWSALALLQAVATNYGGMIALRMLLGVAETAFGPGVPFYLSFFYKQDEIGFRQGIFLSMAPFATAWAGALAYGIAHIKSSIETYKLLFVIEGAPALLLVPIVYFMLPDRASKTKWLTPREREIAKVRASSDGENGREQGLQLKGVVQGLKDYKAWMHALLYFSLNVSYSSLPVFLPTIISEMGFSSIRAQGLSAPPNLAAFLVVILMTFVSDRIRDRSILIIPLALLGACGYLMLALSESIAVRYTAVFLCATGVFPCIGLMLPWVANTHEDDSKRGASFMILNLLGQCGPFLGTRLFPKTEGPYYVKGMSVCAGFLIFVAIVAFTLRILLVLENRKRNDGFKYTL